MADQNREFELLSVEEMRRKYGLISENRPAVNLDPEMVPEALFSLIPLAEFWGIGDDLIRDDLIRRASSQAIEELKKGVSAYEHALDDWLAGPEADSPEPSDEYLAFSAMRMAADLV